MCECNSHLFSFVFGVDISVGNVRAKYKVRQSVVDRLMCEKYDTYSGRVVKWAVIDHVFDGLICVATSRAKGRWCCTVVSLVHFKH